MNEEKLFKYISFLKAEFARHSYDEYIDEDEINQLNIEIRRFKKYVIDSTIISDAFKQEIYKVDFNLEETRHNRSKPSIFFWLFGGDYGKRYAEQENRKNRFQKLSNDLENLEFRLKAM
ncbi:hypothetical protein EV195_101489 [Tenacibaculum skagerrakense]|uniref:RteC protein n=1 Tax=Tenacibaculum skagerrakense TaxID=186571 RepID=A0A4R2P0X4_9FLAO|nr:hypothetical protein [Tenacibaculum skagerrakense]TCP28313.1 hypothetical protein EV195_101489 [Tenacibaculum skagerrakense]